MDSWDTEDRPRREGRYETTPPELTNDAGTPVVCPACGASNWFAQQVTLSYQDAYGLRVQRFVSEGGTPDARLWPDSWGWFDNVGVPSEVYSWECCADDCGNIYAAGDLLQWMLGGPAPAPTSYSDAEAQWLLERLKRIGVKADTSRLSSRDRRADRQIAVARMMREEMARQGEPSLAELDARLQRVELALAKAGKRSEP
jgi:hypothetical protein